MEMKTRIGKITREVTENLENEIKNECAIILNDDITLENINNELHKYIGGNIVERDNMMIILNKDGWEELMDDIKPYIGDENEGISKISLSGVVTKECPQKDDKCVILNKKKAKKIMAAYPIFPSSMKPFSIFSYF